MATITTNRAVNPSQLSTELGGAALIVVQSNPVVVEAPTLGVAVLTAAVEAHVADPGWGAAEASAQAQANAAYLAETEAMRSRIEELANKKGPLIATEHQELSRLVGKLELRRK